MQDPFVIDVSHPITALSCLAPPETLYAPEAAQSHISWLHDGHPPNSNGSEYLLFFITLWHACRLGRADLARTNSLLHPDFFFDSAFRRRVAGFTTATPTVTVLLERLAAAWLVSPHPTHVPDLTSLGGDQRLEIWLSDSVPFPLDAAQCLTSCVTVARSSQYVGYGVHNTGGGGDTDSNERIVTCHWQLLDTCYYGPSSDVGLPLARERGCCWRVGCDMDNGSGIVTVWMPPASDCAPMTDLALFEGSWQGRCALDPGMPSLDSDAPDSPSSESQGQARSREGRPSTSVMLEGSHEAQGVGLIIKALVQQNASASLFLRSMVCVAALLCFAHAIFVLGECPSVSVGCRTS